MTLYRAVFGKDPPPLIRYQPQTGDLSTLQEQLQHCDAVLEALKLNLQKTQLRMKTHADSKRREVEFEVSQFVYVKLQPYRQKSVALHKNKKLAMRYFGPFQVIQRIGKVAYKLDLPSTAKIHPVFHVSLLKRCEGPPAQTVLPSPIICDGNRCKLQPYMALGHCMVKKNNK